MKSCFVTNDLLNKNKSFLKNKKFNCNLASMKKIVLLIVFLISSLAHCQYMDPVASQMGSEFIKADQYIGQDALGYQYFLKNSTLFKLKNGESYQYKNIYLGKISKVDIQNSLKIVVFYESFNTVVILDSLLNEIQKIDFLINKQNIISSAVGISSRNNLWVFNSANQQVGLYDYLNKEYKTISIPITGTIKYYQTNVNNFFWIDENNDAYTCNVFGKIMNLGHVPDFDLVQLVSSLSIVFKKDGVLYYHILNGDKNIAITLEEKSYISFYYVDQNLSIFTDEGITKYQINLP